MWRHSLSPGTVEGSSILEDEQTQTHTHANTRVRAHTHTHTHTHKHLYWYLHHRAISSLSLSLSLSTHMQINTIQTPYKLGYQKHFNIPTDVYRHKHMQVCSLLHKESDAHRLDHTHTDILTLAHKTLSTQD